MTSKYSEGFGERFRFLRRRSDLSQEEIGVKLDVTRQTISGYETSRLSPSSKSIERMCDLYGINPWWLMYGVGGPSSDPQDVSFQKEAAHLSHSGEELTNEQRALIEYIKEDHDVATQLARMLWDKALTKQ
ncbi:helix-turn-helix domain-containing protein [Candidatus Neomarinimicrobiota bacterium]